jgi:hypothetical protein
VIHRLGLAIFLLCLVSMNAGAETPLHAGTMRPGVAAGMGVEYLAPRDIVDMINGAFRPTDRLPEFHAGVNFFGAGFLPLSADWMLKLEYAYVLNTYNISGIFGPGDFTLNAQLPTLVIHYMLADEGLYNLSAGIGAGYHFGTLTTNYGTLVDSYTANGPGLLFEIQGNTATGENLFVHLGVQARWEGIGELKNAAGKSPGINAKGSPATLSWFGVGARLGMSYYF